MFLNDDMSIYMNICRPLKFGKITEPISEKSFCGTDFPRQVNFELRLFSF